MRKTYTSEFKAKLVQEVFREQKSLREIAAENGVAPSVLSQWVDIAREKLALVFDAPDKLQSKLEAKNKTIDELHATIGRQACELDWLQKKSGIRVTRD